MNDWNVLQKCPSSSVAAPNLPRFFAYSLLIQQRGTQSVSMYRVLSTDACCPSNHFLGRESFDQVNDQSQRLDRGDCMLDQQSEYPAHSAGGLSHSAISGGWPGCHVSSLCRPYYYHDQHRCSHRVCHVCGARVVHVLTLYSQMLHT